MADSGLQHLSRNVPQLQQRSEAAELRWALVQGEGRCSNGTHNRPESYVMRASFAPVAPAKLCHASHHRVPEVHCRILPVAVGAAPDPCSARSLLVVAWLQATFSNGVFFFFWGGGYFFFLLLLAVGFLACWLLASVGFLALLSFGFYWLFDSVGYSTYRRMTRNIEMLAFGLRCFR